MDLEDLGHPSPLLDASVGREECKYCPAWSRALGQHWDDLVLNRPFQIQDGLWAVMGEFYRRKHQHLVVQCRTGTRATGKKSGEPCRKACASHGRATANYGAVFPLNVQRDGWGLVAANRFRCRLPELALYHFCREISKDESDEGDEVGCAESGDFDGAEVPTRFFQRRGNECFVNSSLRALMCLPAFRQCISERQSFWTERQRKVFPVLLGTADQPYEAKSRLVTSLLSHRGIRALVAHEIHPQAQGLVIRFDFSLKRQVEQHDAQEFLSAFLSATGLCGQNASPFFIQTRARMVCNQCCDHWEPPPDDHEIFLLRFPDQPGQWTIEELVRSSLVEQQRQRDHGVCRGSYGGQGRFVSPPPRLLVLQLSRFMSPRMKRNDIVTSGDRLDFSTFFEPPPPHATYELRCVIAHNGVTARSGHYVAWVRSEGGWCRYDDDTCSKLGSLFEGCHETGYLYFYELEAVPGAAAVAATAESAAATTPGDSDERRDDGANKKKRDRGDSAPSLSGESTQGSPLKTSKVEEMSDSAVLLRKVYNLLSANGELKRTDLTEADWAVLKRADIAYIIPKLDTAEAFSIGDVVFVYATDGGLKCSRKLLADRSLFGRSVVSGIPHTVGTPYGLDGVLVVYMGHAYVNVDKDSVINAGDWLYAGGDGLATPAPDGKRRVGQALSRRIRGPDGSWCVEAFVWIGRGEEENELAEMAGRLDRLFVMMDTQRVDLTNVRTEFVSLLGAVEQSLQKELAVLKDQVAELHERLIDLGEAVKGNASAAAEVEALRARIAQLETRETTDLMSAPRLQKTETLAVRAHTAFAALNLKEETEEWKVVSKAANLIKNLAVGNPSVLKLLGSANLGALGDWRQVAHQFLVERNETLLLACQALSVPRIARFGSCDHCKFCTSTGNPHWAQITCHNVEIYVAPDGIIIASTELGEPDVVWSAPVERVITGCKWIEKGKSIEYWAKVTIGIGEALFHHAFTVTINLRKVE